MANRTITVLLTRYYSTFSNFLYWVSGRGYTHASLALCLLHIPSKVKNGYFCSQFVLEMLELSGSVSLKKEASLYLPNQLPGVLGELGCVKEVICDPV